MMQSLSPSALQDHVRIRFDRNELSGAFGDIGTDFPLIVGMILAANLDPASVLIMFGAMQVMTGIVYGVPMPVQPLKAMAVLVITQRVNGDLLYGGGLAIGIAMLGLVACGLIDALARVIPKTVVRGIQLGLGLQLAALALTDYLPAEGSLGYALGGAAFVLILMLLGNRRYPPAPFAVALGLLFALLWRVDLAALGAGIGWTLPSFQVPSPSNVWLGFLLLALPQIPLSLGNSILAVRQVAADLFPERSITVRQIGMTYAAMNLVNPFLGGVPICHGSGGMAGHYTFGARTGGSVIIYGAVYLIAGLLFARSFAEVALLFPKPVLAAVLFFEALALMALVRDTTDNQSDFLIVLIVGLLASSLPYGYVIALVVGTLISYAARRGVTGLAK